MLVGRFSKQKQEHWITQSVHNSIHSCSKSVIGRVVHMTRSTG